MFTVEDFEKLFNKYDEVNLPPECVVHEEEHIDHKLVLHTIVWKYGEQFFEVIYAKDNAGYWGDGGSHPPIVAEVFPKEVTVTKYVTKEDNAD